MVSLSLTTFSFTNQYNTFTFELQLSLFICRQVLLVGNKQDLEHLREVELHEGEALASQYKIAFSEVIFKIVFSKVIFKIAFSKVIFKGLSVLIKVSRCRSLRVRTI